MKIHRRTKPQAAPRPRLILRRILAPAGLVDDGEYKLSGPALEIERMGLSLVKLSSVRNKSSFFLIRGGVLTEYIKQSRATAHRASARIGESVMAGLRGSNYVWARPEPVAAEEIATVPTVEGNPWA